MLFSSVLLLGREELTMVLFVPLPSSSEEGILPPAIGVHPSMVPDEKGKSTDLYLQIEAESHTVWV